MLRMKSASSTRLRITTSLAFATVLVWFLLGVANPAGRRLTHGFGAYYSASRLLATGELSARVYDPDYFRSQVREDSHGEFEDIYHPNPPTTTLMFWPLSFLPIETARAIWTAGNVFLLLGGLGLLVIAFARPVTLESFLVVFALGMLFQPVVQNFYYGQAYVLLFFLLSLAAVAFSRGMAGVGGSALALVFLLKTAGMPLLLLLTWQKRWRYLAWLLALLMTVVLLTLPLFPLSMWRAYRQSVPEAINGPWVCVTAYQTTRSLLCHLFTFRGSWNPDPVADLPWLSAGLFVILAAVTMVAILARARRRPTAGFMAVLAWSVVFAPIGEQHHHTLMLVPLAWLILEGIADPPARRIGLLVLPLAVAGYLLPFPVNHPQLQAGWCALLAYPRAYAAWLVLLWTSYRLWAQTEQPLQNRRQPV